MLSHPKSSHVTVSRRVNPCHPMSPAILISDLSHDRTPLVVAHYCQREGNFRLRFIPYLAEKMRPEESVENAIVPPTPATI